MRENTNLADRLREALDESGLTKKQLADACGCAPSNVTAWLNGKAKSIRSDTLNKVASILGVSALWLANGSGSKRSASVGVVERDFNDEEFVMIPEFKIRFAAGAGSEPTPEELSESTKACYRRDWFIKRGLNPDDCIRFRVDGDSMEPLLRDGDCVMVHRRVEKIISGKIYAFSYKDDMRIKYLSTKINGDVIVKSENSEFEDEIIRAEEREYLHIIGVVIERSGDL